MARRQQIDQKFLKIEIASNRKGLLEFLGYVWTMVTVFSKNSRLEDSNWMVGTSLPRLSAKANCSR